MARRLVLTVVPLVRLSPELYDNCNLGPLILGADGNERAVAFLVAGNWFRRMFRRPSKGGIHLRYVPDFLGYRGILMTLRSLISRFFSYTHLRPCGPS